MDFRLADNDFGFENGITIITVNGKSFPYSTAKTLAQLIEDVKKIPSHMPQADMTKKIAPFFEKLDDVILDSLETKPPMPDSVDYKDHIQVYDLVKCVAKNNNEFGEETKRPDLFVGTLYYVQKVIKKNGVTVAYEITGKDVDFPIRVTVTKDEIEFISRPEKAIKENIFEMVSECVCKEPMVLLKNGDKYTGTCKKCKQPKEVVIESAKSSSL